MLISSFIILNLLIIFIFFRLIKNIIQYDNFIFLLTKIDIKIKKSIKKFEKLYLRLIILF